MSAENMFGAWGLVSRNTPFTGTAFYVFDERGNVAQRVGSSGAILSTDVYDAWGKKRSGPADVFGFGGQAGYYTDTATGLLLCTHRHYDPQQGRFLIEHKKAPPRGSSRGRFASAFQMKTDLDFRLKPAAFRRSLPR